MTPVELVKFLESHRWSLTIEKQCQAEIAGQLSVAGVAFEREVRLGDGSDIIDFLVGDVGIEVKIKGQRREIYRQCERYCLSDRIATLILATNAPMGMPADINKRPILMARLGLAWL